MDTTINKIKNTIHGYNYDLSNEKSTQNLIDQKLREQFSNLQREYKLSDKHFVDFMVDGIAIEVKIKGNATNILRQCESYCSYDEVKALILVTSKSMGFPEYINNKPCYYISLSQGML